MGEQITYSISEAEDNSVGGVSLAYFDKQAFTKLLESNLPSESKTYLFSQLARFNALYMVSRAGSGHLGSSFSSLDIVSWLYLNVLGDDDRYFSSKGHDSPGLYSVHAALGIIEFEKIHSLRRLNGLPGHPDVRTPGAFTNTGSLGMGVSKAKGFITADEINGNKKGHVYVLTGDGELQEGQFWESLISASRMRDGRLTVVVDHNKIQSDTYVEYVSDLGDLESKFRSFGWDVVRIDGHNFCELETALSSPSVDGKPLAIIADTIKGKGVSFMEHTSMADSQMYYAFHSGAPSVDNYQLAKNELLQSINMAAAQYAIGLPDPTYVEIQPQSVTGKSERMIPAYSEELLAQAGDNATIVAMDADLVLDTGLIPFKDKFPERFVECGIAEQDMVSQAGTMALSGCLPIVHSFACFLTSRASEQIYNNCSQGGKIIYVGSLAGVIPGGPGHSHQAVRDYTAMMAMPGITILDPVCAAQARKAVDWAVNVNDDSTYIRLTSIPYEAIPELIEIDNLRAGQGHLLQAGTDIMLIAFGPIMSIQLVKVVNDLRSEGVDAGLIVTPWVNSIDVDWISHVLDGVKRIMIVENHFRESGAGSYYITELANSGLLADKHVVNIGVEGIPACGTNDEVLDYHGLTTEKITAAVKGFMASH